METIDDKYSNRLGRLIADTLTQECIARANGQRPRINVRVYINAIDDVVALGEASEILEQFEDRRLNQQRQIIRYGWIDGIRSIQSPDCRITYSRSNNRSCV